MGAHCLRPQGFSEHFLSWGGAVFGPCDSLCAGQRVLTQWVRGLQVGNGSILHGSRGGLGGPRVRPLHPGGLCFFPRSSYGGAGCTGNKTLAGLGQAFPEAVRSDNSKNCFGGFSEDTMYTESSAHGLHPDEPLQENPRVGDRCSLRPHSLCCLLQTTVLRATSSGCLVRALHTSKSVSEAQQR